MLFISFSKELNKVPNAMQSKIIVITAIKVNTTDKIRPEYPQLIKIVSLIWVTPSVQVIRVILYISPAVFNFYLTHNYIKLSIIYFEVN